MRMNVTPNLEAARRIATKADFDREAEEFARKKQASQLDAMVKKQALMSAGGREQLEREKLQLERDKLQAWGS